MTYLGTKKILDQFFSAILLILLLPLLCILALGVLLNLGRPVFFVQLRTGLGGEPFRLVKFRSMRLTTERQGASDYERLTRFGSFLRVTSLDELPSLINILLGQMSFVGPRPLLEQYLPIYSSKHRGRHSVRPGLTGLAQVAGRNSLEWSEKLDLDVEYVSQLSLALDLSILFKTVYVVFSGRGTSLEGSPGEARLTEGYESTIAAGD